MKLNFWIHRENSRIEICEQSIGTFHQNYDQTNVIEIIVYVRPITFLSKISNEIVGIVGLSE